MYSAIYLPTPSRNTKHGFPTEKAAWEYICPGCPDRLGVPDAHPCACTCEWEVLPTKQHYLLLLASSKTVLRKMLDRLNTPSEDMWLTDYVETRQELYDCYDALSDDVRQQVVSPD